MLFDIRDINKFAEFASLKNEIAFLVDYNLEKLTDAISVSTSPEELLRLQGNVQTLKALKSFPDAVRDSLNRQK